MAGKGLLVTVLLMIDARNNKWCIKLLSSQSEQEGIGSVVSG